MSRNKIQFGRPPKKQQKATAFSVKIDNLSLEGCGVAKHDGKTIFVEGAIPGETVVVKIDQRHKNYDEASLISIETLSQNRIDPNCEHFNHCGGCQLQHIAPLAQLEYKQQAVLSLLLREAKIKPNKITDALFSAPYHYRRTARIGVNKHRQTNTPIVGFRRKNSSKILQVSQCNILPKPLSSLFDKLRECLAKIDNAKAITHIEYLQGDTKGALTFRCMEPLAPAAIALLNTLVNAFNLQGFIRYDHSLVPLADNNGELSYAINNINLTFGSGNFLQVNAQINQQMIDRAIQWLALEADDQVLDLFSGLGNFSLPMAKHVCKVTALEGSEAMVTLACENAALNSIENCEFHLADLTKDEPLRPFFEHHYTKVLLDPPRSGATELIKNLLSSSANLSLQPHRILYVACDPLSLAKDAKLLKELGYEMANFCVMDMFPNTVHIETMALFKKAATPLKKVKAKKNKSLFAH